MENEINSLSIYDLSRAWWDWCFENPEKINPNHGALYFFIIEHCNRLGWKYKFGLPSGMAKEAIGIRNYRTYVKTFNDLVEWDFIKLLEKSKNQYSSNIICLSLAHVKNTKAHTKALSKASIKHVQKQVQSIATIIRPNTKYLIPNTKYDFFDFTFEKIDPDLLIAFKKWIQYREEISKPFMSQLQIESEYENLLSMASFNNRHAIEIINRSIGSGWQNLQSFINNSNHEPEESEPEIRIDWNPPKGDQQ